MTLALREKITFPSDLYLDRKRGEYTFIPSPDTVVVVGRGEPANLEELELLFHPYTPQKLGEIWDMFDEQVLAHLKTLEAVPPAPDVRPPSPIILPGDAGVLVQPPSADAHLPRIIIPGLQELGGGQRQSPLLVVQDLKKQLRGKFAEMLNQTGSGNAIFEGAFDEQIQEMVVNLCREIPPKHLLGAALISEGNTPVDQATRSAMTSQAIGSQMALNEMELFMLAKSAILQSLSRTGYKDIMGIKHSLLLDKPSASLERKLIQYYRDMERFLSARRVDPGIAGLITRSRFIYIEGEASRLEDRTMALGIADAFMVLKYASRKAVEILYLLPKRLRKLLSMTMEPAISAAEKLLQEICYTEHRKALDTALSGGDHCDFFPINATQRGIVIFDVSGHEERASRYRDMVVRFFNDLPFRDDPSHVLAETNRFALRSPFPEDLFVSMYYGIIDAQRDLFIYANAGHHSPFLVRLDRVATLPDPGGMAINVAEGEYRNAEVGLQNKDCLVFYTDGLTESVLRSAAAPGAEAGHPPGRKVLFGKDRVEASLKRKQVYHRKTKEAVHSILMAVREEGFEVEDDITVQMYRHV